MINFIAIVLYVAFAVLVGLCGSHRRMGFLGTFLVSLLLTPIIVLLILILTAPSSNRLEREHRPRRH